MSWSPSPGTGPVGVGGQRSVTVARPRVGPPPWAVPSCRELSPSRPGSRPGRRPSHGDGGRPRGAQPNASKNLSASQAEPPWEERSLSSIGPCWVRSCPGVAGNSGRSGQRTLDATAGGSTSNSLTSGGRDRELGFKSPTRLPRALQTLGRKAVGHRGRASPTERVGSPSPPRANDRHSRRPCHPRAISSGHERYIAVSHGHFRRAVPLGTRF